MSYKSRSIFVGGLSLGMTESKLYSLFNNIGSVSSVRICRDWQTQRCLGYGYINYYKIDDAEKAIKRMNFRFIDNKQIHVLWYQKTKYNEKANIFVKNLDESIDNKILYDTFSVFGEIISCKVMINKNTQKSLGYGYIQFIDDKCAQIAIKKVNGLKICNKPIYAQLFIPKNKRRINNSINSHFTNIYVKYIPKSLDKDNLKKLFEKETGGKITNLIFWRYEFGLSACLNFENTKYAKIAIEKLNGRQIDGNKLYVVRSQKRRERKQYLKHQFITNYKRKTLLLKKQKQKTYFTPCIYPSYSSYPIQSVPISSIPIPYNIQPFTHESQPIQSSIHYQSVPNQSAPMIELEELTSNILLTMTASQRKRAIGERLFAQIQSIEPRLAPKLTGMLLEIDNDELLILLSNHKKLFEKVNEALSVLKKHQKQLSISNISTQKLI